MKKICGIYCITNIVNGKQYVGLSKDCLKRWSDHYSKAYTSKKEDDLRKPLYLAMRKYGRENFSFTILEECELELLKELTLLLMLFLPYQLYYFYYFYYFFYPFLP